MNSFWQKYKGFIVIGLYFILIVCVVKFVIFPLDSEIKEKRVRAEELNIEKEISEKKVKEVPVLKEKIDSIRALEGRLDVFSETENALPVIESIERLAFDTGNTIEIDILSDGLEKTDENTKSKKNEVDQGLRENLPGERYMTMRLNVDGDFNTILLFIRKLENFKYFSDIISIKILKNEEELPLASRQVQDPVNFIQSDLILGTVQNETEQKDKVLENPLEAVLEVVFYIKN